MARKARAEVEGGLYHIIVRGNNRRRMFDSPGRLRKVPFAARGRENQTAILPLCLLSDDQPRAPFQLLHITKRKRGQA